MPSRITRILLVILFTAAFGCLSTNAAFVYTETFASGSNGWHWIRPSGLWQSSINGGFASVTSRPFSGFVAPFPNWATLSSTNTANVSSGAFTGNYRNAEITTIGFKYWASKIVYNTPTDITSRVELRWGNSSNYYYKFFTPTTTGTWLSFQSDLRCYASGGWTGPDQGAAFDGTIQDVRFVEFRVYGQESLDFGGTTNSFRIDDIFITTLSNYTSSASNQTITFPSIPAQTTTNVLNLSATASSGLPVYFSVLSGPAVIGCCTSVTFTGAGVVSIVANQNGDTNYNAAASVTNTFVVNSLKSPATVNLAGLSQVYDGSVRLVTATTVPTGLTVAITYNGSAAPPVHAGSYVVTGEVNDATYEGFSTGTLVVAKATPAINLMNLFATYDGSAKCVSASTVPTNLTVHLTYQGLAACPTNPGSYTVVGSVNSSNYAGSVTNTLLISKLGATVHLAGLTTIYNESSQCASATTTPTGLVVNLTYNGLTSCPTNAGTYTVIGQIDDPIYAGSSTGSLTINKAIGSVSFLNLTNTYTGDAYCAQALSSPPGRLVNITYDGLAGCPVNAGDYVVVGTIDNANYEGAGTNIMTIRKAPQSVTFNALPVFVYGDAPYTMSASSDRGLPVSFSSSNPAVAAVSGSTLSIYATGVVAITAGQSGTTNYAAATNVVRMAVVTDLVIELGAQWSGSNILLDIMGNTGRAYVVEYNVDLTQTNWPTLLFIPSLPSSTYQVSDPATNALRYYRLKRSIWSP